MQLAVQAEVPGQPATQPSVGMPGCPAGGARTTGCLAGGARTEGRLAGGAGVTGCVAMASKEDSYPAGMACPTLTVGEVGGVLSKLEMDSY